LNATSYINYGGFTGNETSRPKDVGFIECYRRRRSLPMDDKRKKIKSEEKRLTYR